MNEAMQTKIKFNDTFKSTNYLEYVSDLFSDYDNFRNKKYSQLALQILQKRFAKSSLWLTHSATGALEMIAKAIGIQQGDEVIMSSFTFVSTANAFVSHGAIPVFSEITSVDFNLDVEQLEKQITAQTKAIVITHYGGHSADLNALKAICAKHKIYLIEDAAMAYGNYYQDEPLGTIGDFGVISFDITKQISAVQGGVLICNRAELDAKFDAIYHIGTNRTQFMQAAKPYYEWVSVGSKYQMNELNALALYDNLMHEAEILEKRKRISAHYHQQLSNLTEQGIQVLSEEKIKENIHLYYLLLPSKAERDDLMAFLKNKDIEALFHYIPLHTSEMGKSFREVCLPISTAVSERLLRLPLHVHLSEEEIHFICLQIKSFLNDNR